MLWSPASEEREKDSSALSLLPLLLLRGDEVSGSFDASPSGRAATAGDVAGSSDSMVGEEARRGDEDEGERGGGE